MSAVKPGASTSKQTKQAKQAKASDEEARPEVYNSIVELLRSLGIDEHEPQIIDMIIDFIFSYTTDVLQDAQAFSEATGNAQGTVGQQDVELAIHSRMDISLAQSPNLENLLKQAAAINSKPLPQIQAAPGLPLPDKNTLLAPNAQYSRKAAEAAKEAAAEAAKAAALAAAEAATLPAAVPQAVVVPQPAGNDFESSAAAVPAAEPAAIVPPVAANVTAAPLPAVSLAVAVPAAAPSAVPAAEPPAPAPPAAAAVPAGAAPAPATAVDVPVSVTEEPVAVTDSMEDVDMNDDGPQLIPPPT